MRRYLRLPSPPMAVAITALFLVLGGSAFALEGTNLVFSDDIRNSTIRTQDIRNRTIRGKDLRGNTLHGRHISERRLGKVRSAARADSAGTADSAGSAGFASRAGVAGSAGSAGNADTVAGNAVRSYSAELPDDGSEDPFVFGGVRLSFSCNGGNPELNASNATTVPAKFNLFGMHDGITPDGQGDSDFTAGDSNGPTGSRGTGTMSILFDTGRVTTVEYGFQEDGFGAETDRCLFWGRVISG